jgi:hypothetical protein
VHEGRTKQDYAQLAPKNELGAPGSIPRPSVPQTFGNADRLGTCCGSPLPPALTAPSAVARLAKGSRGVKENSKQRFDCLAGYARNPHIVMVIEELNEG